eukprot:CAMPEP_0185340668 /NCGR_PEP_ID=MMETSP1363-20130426/98239_1 /TAXON_ID=38817 /ORGANISM="Gephyrocapsa oceanica, Strain RCC1303" /LENGTH=526 /DNA_ID=CAMNT_0027939895 /DNA_START=63 /DNA_END=1644 /DNA_ORIENTATION=+
MCSLHLLSPSTTTCYSAVSQSEAGGAAEASASALLSAQCFSGRVGGWRRIAAPTRPAWPLVRSARSPLKHPMPSPPASIAAAASARGVPLGNLGAPLLRRLAPAVSSAAAAALVALLVPLLDLCAALRRALTPAGLPVSVAVLGAAVVAAARARARARAGAALAAATCAARGTAPPVPPRACERAGAGALTKPSSGDEIAVAAARARRLLKLAAARVLEVGHGAELRQDGPARVEATHELCERFLRVVLVAELCVDVAGEVVGEVLADAELLQLAAHRDELLEDVLVKLLEVILQLLLALREWVAHRVVLLRRRQVHVLQEDGLREDGPVVDAAAPVAVPARPHLKVEWTVDFVFLGAEDLRKVLAMVGGRLRCAAVSSCARLASGREPAEVILKLAAARVLEVGHGAELRQDGPARVEATLSERERRGSDAGGAADGDGRPICDEICAARSVDLCREICAAIGAAICGVAAPALRNAAYPCSCVWGLCSLATARGDPPSGPESAPGGRRVSGFSGAPRTAAAANW